MTPRPSWTRKAISGAFVSGASWVTVAAPPAAGVFTFCRAASKGEHRAFKPGQVCEQRRTPPALRAWRRLERSESRRKARRAGGICSVTSRAYAILAIDEKHYRQLPHRLGTPLIREVLAALRREELSATVAAEKLGLGVPVSMNSMLPMSVLRPTARPSVGNPGFRAAIMLPTGPKALNRCCASC